MNSLPFRWVWGCDFEFISDPGERPLVVCMVAKELRTGQLIRLWRDELPACPPFPVGDDSLFVAYAAAAELGCFLKLGWPMPTRILDLHFEYLAKTNGRKVSLGDGLLAALAAHGIPGITKEAKEAGRALVMRGGPWTAAERQEVLDYCQTDVDPLGPLLQRMLPGLRSRSKGLGQGLLRGRYSAAVAHMEYLGVPVNAPLLERLRTSWDAIKLSLVAEVDQDYGVYEGGTFKTAKFAAWLRREGIPWPVTDTGAPSLERDTFHEMARGYPQIGALGDLRHAMGNLRLESLSVGGDRRNRVSLMPFRAKTGRNQPSNAKYIFGPGKWMRGLIRPDPGKVLAYIDWSSQEVGIAAALSGDPVMIDDVQSGDPYLALAKMAGLAPEWATKQSHEAVRDQCKACVLGANYGMGYKTLAVRIGSTVTFAKHLLKTMAERYRVHTKWSESVIGAGYMTGRLSTVFGWPMQVGTHTRQTTVVNYPMQAGGSEMLRIASCLATERGVRICGPVHDALLIEADKDTAEQEIAACQAAMAEASRAVLGGMEIKTDVKIVCWPDHYMDKRGIVMWQRVMKLLRAAELEREGRKVGRYIGIDIAKKASTAEADSIVKEGLVKRLDSSRRGVSLESPRARARGGRGMTYATNRHRAMDRAFAEALVRDAAHDYPERRRPSRCTVPFVHSSYARKAEDDYQTIDTRCLEALLGTWTISDPIVDCCAPHGSGIVDTLRAMGRDASGVPDAFGEFEARYIVTNPPYDLRVVDVTASATIARVRSGQVLGAALLMRANWDMGKRRAQLFALPEYAGQTRMRFRPWWSQERKAPPIHNFVWHVWSWHRPSAEPVVRYWPKPSTLLSGI